MGMLPRFHPTQMASGLLLLVLAGCSETPGQISRDSTPFDGISKNAAISVGGTEPFWALNITPNGDGSDARIEAKYSAPHIPDGISFSLTRFAGNNGLGYSGEMDGQPVNLALTPGDCSDGMSDRTYPYTATLLLGEETLYGCAHTDLEPYSDDELEPSRREGP